MPISLSKQIPLSFLTKGPFVVLFGHLTRAVVAVFVLHRFTDEEAGIEGKCPKHLRRNLEYIRRKRYTVASIEQVLNGTALDRSGGKKAIVFTVDDGYEDFHRVGAPIFAAYDCPVSVFLTTGFIDGDIWMWWDRVEFAIEHSDANEFMLELGGREVRFYCRGPEERSRAVVEVVSQLKMLPDADRERALEQITSALGTSLPERPPDRYAPMTWEQVRKGARNGVTYGPHTVTHPILSRCSGPRCALEISNSWKRVREETDSAIPVFCYPNGDSDSFSTREIRYLREASLDAALTSIPGYVDPPLRRGAVEADRFCLPRFGYPSNHASFVTIISGLEKLSGLIRSRK